MFLHLAKNLKVKLPIRSVSTPFLCDGFSMQGQIVSLAHLKSDCNFARIQHRNLRTSVFNYKEELPLVQKLKQELLVLKTVNFKELKSSPFPAIVYGFGGIIPFVFPPLYFLIGSYSPFLATSQLMYGAAILAFVGGVKWGNALAKNDVSHYQIGMSTIPSLIAWGSLLVPEPLGFLVVSSGLLGALYVDLTSSSYPPWFCAMRCTLTSIATLSLVTTFICNILH